MATQATYEDANLILRLYEMRREEKLREARAWFAQSFAPNSLEESMQIAPPGSKENAYLRMLASYWEMACSFVTAGVLNQELFFESSGELLAVYERMRPVLPGLRQMFKNPKAFHNLETVANAYIKFMGPEAYAGMQDVLKMMASAAAKKAGQ